MRSKLTFEDFNVGDELHPGEGIVVKTAPLRHPNGATAYRVEYDGNSVCYVTDTEHDPDTPDQAILDFIQNADLVIYDSTYTDEEFPAKVGWGHSTWQEGIRLCRAANAKRLALFHHDPDHNDAAMTVIEQKARSTWADSFAARDEMVLRIE